MKYDLPPYKGNESYYTRLIDKINDEVNFPVYLDKQGYDLTAKSAGSYEFRKGNDKIVLNRSRNPMTYFNRNDSTDIGKLFKFIKNREVNFYEAIKRGLEACNSLHELTFKEHQKTPKSGASKEKSLEEKYNVKELVKPVYLTKECALSPQTINHPMFKGRIFNAYHHTDAGGKIPNIAFPRYQGDDLHNIKNYLLYNRDYHSKSTGKKEKFRIYLNKQDHYLWTSRPSDDYDLILVSEAAPDALAYAELHKYPKGLYVAMGGNVHEKKLQELLKIVGKLQTQKNKQSILLITDNDESGFRFDTKIVTAITNELQDKVVISTQDIGTKSILEIQYKEDFFTEVDVHLEKIQPLIERINSGIKDPGNKAEAFALKNKLIVKIPVIEEENKLDNSRKLYKHKSNVSGINEVLKTIANLYSPVKILSNKSESKDWKQDLINKKKAMTKNSFLSL